MHKNAIKRAGRVIFRKKSNYKKPETRPEPVMSNPNPTRTRRNISKPDPTRTRKKFQNPNPTFGNPTHHYCKPNLFMIMFFSLLLACQLISLMLSYISASIFSPQKDDKKRKKSSQNQDEIQQHSMLAKLTPSLHMRRKSSPAIPTDLAGKNFCYLQYYTQFSTLCSNFE